MLRGLYRALALTATLAFVGIPAYADHKDNDWSRAYVLTPLEHKRLQAKGLRDTEIFAAANIAHVTNWDVDEIVNMIMRGETPMMITERFALDPDVITRENPDWKTPEWKAAVERGDYFWIPPRSTSMGGPPPSMGGSPPSR